MKLLNRWCSTNTVILWLRLYYFFHNKIMVLVFFLLAMEITKEEEQEKLLGLNVFLTVFFSFSVAVQERKEKNILIKAELYPFYVIPSLLI